MQCRVMALEVSSYVLALFPILLIISLLLTLTVSVLIAKKRVNFQVKRFSFLYRHWKTILLAPFIVPFAITLIIAFGFLAGAPDSLDPIFYFSYDLYHLMFAAYMGILVGFILSYGYLARGVSAFVFIGLVFVTIVLATASLGSIEVAIYFIVNELGELFVVLLLVDFLPCSPTFLLRRDKKKYEIQRMIKNLESSTHETLDSLKKRVENDGDISARTAIETLLNQDGLMGDIIQRVASRIKIIENPIIEIPTDSKFIFFASMAREHSFSRVAHHWRLSKHEFDERVKINRVAYGGLLIFTVSLILYLESYYQPLMSLSLSLLFGLILLSFVLAAFDDLLFGRRANANHIVSDVRLMFTPLMTLLDDPTVNLDDFIGAGPQPIDPSQIQLKTRVNTDELDESSLPPSIRRFVRRVKKNANDVYEEDIYSFYVAVSGLIFLIPTMLFVIMERSKDNAFIVGARLMHAIGLLVIIIGSVWWIHYRRSRMFFGLTRGNLEMILVSLSITESGISDIGKILYPTPPPRYSMMQWIITASFNSIYHKMQKIKDFHAGRNLDEDEVISSVKMRKFMTNWVMASAIILIYVYFVLPSFLLLFATTMTALAIASFLVLRTERKRLLEMLYELSSSNLDFETVDGLLMILDRVYRYPLRVATIGHHERLDYVGLVYTTTKGIDFNVGVFIPATL